MREKIGRGVSLELWRIPLNRAEDFVGSRWLPYQSRFSRNPVRALIYQWFVGRWFWE